MAKFNVGDGNIKVEGYKGTWYVIDKNHLRDKKIYLLEHETYGEDACIIIDEDMNVILDDVYNGFQDLWDVENGDF